MRLAVAFGTFLRIHTTISCMPNFVGFSDKFLFLYRYLTGKCWFLLFLVYFCKLFIKNILTRNNIGDIIKIEYFEEACTVEKILFRKNAQDRQDNEACR